MAALTAYRKIVFDDPTDEWHEWYRLTPQERWAETEKLWVQYLAMGGSLDPEFDPQSPFASLPGYWNDLQPVKLDPADRVLPGGGWT